MIKFIKVAGDVMVDDRKRRHTVAAYKGMTIPVQGADCTIRASKGSRAILSLNGKRVILEARHILRVRPDGRAFRRKVKHVMGKAWREAKDLAGTTDSEWEEELTIPNAVIGVRG
jgi:hypothetical protein